MGTTAARAEQMRNKLVQMEESVSATVSKTIEQADALWHFAVTARTDARKAVDGLKAEIVAVAKAKRQAEVTKAEATAATTYLDGIVTTTKAAAAGLREKKKEVEEKLRTTKNDLSKADEMLESAKTAVVEAKTKLMETKTKVDELSGTVEAVTEELRETQDAVAEAKRKAEVTKAEAEGVAKELKETQDAVAEAKRKAEATKAEAEGVTKELEDTQDAVAEAKRKAEVTKAEAEGVAKELKETQDAVAEAKRKAEATKAEAEGVTKELEDTQDAVAEAEVEGVTKELEGTQDAVAEVKEEGVTKELARAMGWAARRFFSTPTEPIDETNPLKADQGSDIVLSEPTGSVELRTDVPDPLVLSPKETTALIGVIEELLSAQKRGSRSHKIRDGTWVKLTSAPSSAGRNKYMYVEIQAGDQIRLIQELPKTTRNDSQITRNRLNGSDLGIDGAVITLVSSRPKPAVGGPLAQGTRGASRRTARNES